MTVHELAAAFHQAGVEAWLHALDLGTGAEVAHRADELVVPASIFKVPVLLELFRQHSAGEIDATAQVLVPVEGRAPGPFGISMMRDPMSMSLRDLAWQMIGISDNAATDVICSHVGLDAVNATIAGLGLTQTVIGGDCRDLFATMVEDAGVGNIDDFPNPPTAELLARVRAFDPLASLMRTSPRDMTTLLRLIWSDEAAPTDACAEVRRVLGLQVWPHRLASGFPEDDVRTSGKTGSLPTLRNEVGVVEYPDGGRYAVAVFTRSSSLAAKNPAADAVIGRAARLAVDALRT
jgi:beta-lactamase class A